ncbi:unnamed protein product [Linum tenue]|uniref:Uncharacterized protein n=1 Tax=Linum tenue TaxID=586396 RepID=A0AAV0S9A2_9ROSI|nr:unnamed protein product [Linum tenue]
METERLRPAAAAGSYQDEENNSAFSGCNCFGSLFSRWGRKPASNESNGYLLMQNRGGAKTGEGENQQQKTEPPPSSWVMSQVKKLKEVSEMVAGPKWKNFIRKKQRRNQKFNYNAESYALNFDCGLEEEEYDYVPGFSQRFAAAAAAVPVDNRNREAFGL